MSIWRWRERLPSCGREHEVTLGEGQTPLIAIAADGQPVLVKCEHLNPTGSFKDRIAAVALSLAAECGLRGVFGTSSGNGGAAAAAYAARAGLDAVLLALATTPPAKLAQIRAAGALVALTERLGHDPAATVRLAREVLATAPQHGFLPFLTGARYAPAIMTGAETIAWELAGQHAAATHVYAPVGGGGLYASLWRGYRRAGLMPRLVAVQPSGCGTVRSALAGGGGELTGPSTTAISGLQVAALFDDDVPAAVRGSGGHLVEVGDEQVYSAQAVLARTGILVEPAGATALAGALADAAAGRISGRDEVVVIATGAGWKDAAALARLAPGRPVPHVSSVSELLRRVSDDPR